MSFTAVRNDKKDPYMHWYGIAPGNKLRIVNHGAEVFSGVILTVGLDGSITANDPGWYLTKSQIVLQLDGAAAPDAVARMCAKAGAVREAVRGAAANRSHHGISQARGQSGGL